MPDTQILSGHAASLGKIDGNLRVGRRAKIEASDGKFIIVTGGVYFEGGADIDCSLRCDKLNVSHFGVIRINGDLEVNHELEILHSIEVSGKTRADLILGEGKIRSHSINARNIRANGVLEVKDGLEVPESFQLNGKLDTSGHVKLQNLTVTGQAKIGGGEILGRTDVHGKFETESLIQLGEMSVFGNARLRSGCKGERIATFGKLESLADTSCRAVEVQGTTIVEGNLESSRIWVRGKLQVSGDLSTSEILETFGTTEVGKKFSGGRLRVGGKLIADHIVLTEGADIAGRLETKRGIKAVKKVTIRSGSRCEGPIVADAVEIGESYANILSWQTDWIGQNISMRLIGKQSNVQDVYATNVHMGTASSAKHIFAQNVELEKGCVVEQITYTGELKLPAGTKSVYINRQPNKIEKLPSPPL
jgi:cytoskeletal protein CcmA (bactofilin family)